jgi:signal transduction histidine kinase
MWIAWFMSNALTGLTMLPALIGAMTAVTGPREPVDRRHVAECVLIAAGLVGTCALVFLPLYSNPGARTLSLYAPLPLLIWAALRCGTGGASFAATLVALAAVWATDRDTGPFVSSSLDDKVLGMQLFVLLSTVPVLVLAAVASARRQVVHMHGALLASLQDQVAIIDARGIVLQISDSWLRFATSAEAQSFDRVRERESYLDALRKAANRGNARAAEIVAGVSSVLSRTRPRFQMEYEQDSASGRVWYTLNAEVLERAEGGAVITRSDVTERRRADIEIQEQRRELSHLARVAVLGQLSGAFAHELRQPLSSIRVNAEAGRLLLQRDPIDVHELSMIFKDIVSDDERAGRVIDSLRGLLKTGETRIQEVRPRDLIDEVLGLAHVELITRRVRATVSVEPDLPLLFGDRVQLQQVLLNLLLNACEAMDATDDARRAIVLTVARAGESDVTISVRDNGSGIPRDLIDRLFEPFVTTKPQGFGLGLSITRTIVAAHGGRMWAENNADRGATIHCLLGSPHATPVASRASHTPAGVESGASTTSL